MKILPVILPVILLLTITCSNPTEIIIIETFTVIQEINNSEDYMISPLGGIIPVTPKFQKGLPILRGKFVNLSEDTLFNKKMKFIISVSGNPSLILSDTFGYMTLDKTEFAYFPEYPYKIERDLIPGKEYNIYVVGDTLDLDISNSWWYNLVNE